MNKYTDRQTDSAGKQAWLLSFALPAPRLSSCAFSAGPPGAAEDVRVRGRRKEQSVEGNVTTIDPFQTAQLSQLPCEGCGKNLAGGAAPFAQLRGRDLKPDPGRAPSSSSSSNRAAACRGRAGWGGQPGVSQASLGPRSRSCALASLGPFAC